MVSIKFGNRGAALNIGHGDENVEVPPGPVKPQGSHRSSRAPVAIIGSVMLIVVGLLGVAAIIYAVALIAPLLVPLLFLIGAIIIFTPKGARPSLDAGDLLGPLFFILLVIILIVIARSFLSRRHNPLGMAREEIFKDDITFARRRLWNRREAGCLFLGGILALHHCDYQDAIGRLAHVLQTAASIGPEFKKAHTSALLYFPITDECIEMIKISDGVRATTFALAGAHEDAGNPQQAFKVLCEFLKDAPGDLAACLLALLIREGHPGAIPDATPEQVLKMTDGTPARSPLGVRILRHRAGALRELGQLEGAMAAINKAISLHAGFGPETLPEFLYERAMIHAAMGNADGARADWETIHAMKHDFRDVAARLGM